MKKNVVISVLLIFSFPLGAFAILPKCGGSICKGLERVKKETQKELGKIRDHVSDIPKNVGDLVVSLGQDIGEVSGNLLELSFDLSTFGEFGRQRDKARANLALENAKAQLEKAKATYKTDIVQYNLRIYDLKASQSWLKEILKNTDTLALLIAKNFDQASKLSKNIMAQKNTSDQHTQLVKQQMQDLKEWANRFNEYLEIYKEKVGPDTIEKAEILQIKVDTYMDQLANTPAWLIKPEAGMEALLELTSEAKLLTSYLQEQIQTAKEDTEEKIKSIEDLLEKVKIAYAELEK